MDLAETFYNQRVLGNGIVPDSSVLDSMVICLVKLRRFGEARSHLDSILASGYVPSRKASSLVVDELCNQDRFLKGFLYFEQVQKRGSGLWLSCCKRLIKGLCDQGHLDEAIRMLDTLCEMPRMPLPLNLYRFLKLGMLDKGRVMFSHMVKKGVPANVFTYHVMIGTYCKEGNVDYALRLFENCMGLEDISRNVHCYTNLISGFYKKRGLDKAVDLLTRMLDDGVVPDLITHFVLLKMLPKCYELKYAMVILQAIFDNGCGIGPPVIDDLGNIEEKVESLLEEEIARKDANLAAVGYAVVTTALCSQRIFFCRLVLYRENGQSRMHTVTLFVQFSDQLSI